MRTHVQTLTIPSYVRALEAQQHKLEAAVHTMYYRLLAANAWPGPRLMEYDGNPLLHEILAVLGLLETSDADEARPMEQKLGSEEPQYDPLNLDGSIVGISEQKSQTRRTTPSKPSHDALDTRNHSSHFLPLLPLPEEVCWDVGMPRHLSRTATNANSLTAPQRTESLPSSINKFRTPRTTSQQQGQSLPVNSVHQQTFMIGESSRSSTHRSQRSEAMNWDPLDEPTSRWHVGSDIPGEQRVQMAMEAPGSLDGPCELDGLWQSSKDRTVPQATPPGDEKMDKELPTHFFKIGW